MILPAIVGTAFWNSPPWLLMWTLAGAIFAGCKWLTWWHAASSRGGAPAWKSLAYLLLWPGMDADGFLRKSASAPASGEWAWAAVKTFFGAVLLWSVVRTVPNEHGLVAGWIGMFGMVLLLHFGTFHLLSLPAGAGYGGPTIYFLLQGAGVLLERSPAGKRAGLRGSFTGWLFALTVTAAPAYWLFHPPFVLEVIIPFLEAIGAR